jgi:hypothetical protein
MDHIVSLMTFKYFFNSVFYHLFFRHFFGILTIRNIRRAYQRIANTLNTRTRQCDIQWSKMLLLQVIITVGYSLPLAVSQLNATVTLASIKSPLRLAIDNIASQIGRHLAFLNSSISFYTH